MAEPRPSAATEKPSTKRKRPRTVIPLLSDSHFCRGSRHDAPTPKLVDFDLRDDGAVTVEWRATGSSTYAVTARGKVCVTVDASGRVQRGGLDVQCSCPDGERQRSTTSSLCKHAYAATQSVLDPDADDAIERLRSRAAAAARAVEAAQDTELPGERGRITNALDRLPPKEVVQLVRDSLRSIDGLRAIAAHIFPPEIAPAPNVLHCLRCDEDFDPAFAGRNACKMLHPDDFVKTCWDGSKKSWRHCRRCDANFHLDGFHSCGKQSMSDDGEYCFQGEHTTDPTVVAEEKWDEDPDY